MCKYIWFWYHIIFSLSLNPPQSPSPAASYSFCPTHLQPFSTSPCPDLISRIPIKGFFHHRLKIYIPGFRFAYKHKSTIFRSQCIARPCSSSGQYRPNILKYHYYHRWPNGWYYIGSNQKHINYSIATPPTPIYYTYYRTNNPTWPQKCMHDSRLLIISNAFVPYKLH